MKKYLEEALSLQQLTKELNNPGSAFYFATKEGKVIGYLKINSGEAQTELKDSNALEIERIYVLKKFQKQYIGQLLYDIALRIAKDANYSYVWLGVWEKNEKAIAFYKKNGFKYEMD